MTKDQKLYGTDDQETLNESVEEVIERLVDDVYEPGEGTEQTLDRINWPVKVHVFRRIDPAPSIPSLTGRVIRDLLELLDEEHADPNGYETKPTEKMLKAAKTFVTAVISEYVPWACEPTGEVIEVTREMAEGMV